MSRSRTTSTAPCSTSSWKAMPTDNDIDEAELSLIDRDLIESRRVKPKPGEELRVFGYGSLMWRPDFPYIEIVPAALHGYHRAFCIRSTHYRGTREKPGLVLGLDRGGM